MNATMTQTDMEIIKLFRSVDDAGCVDLLCSIW